MVLCCMLPLLLLPQVGSVTKDDFPLETLGPVLKDVQQEVTPGHIGLITVLSLQN
jgi:hypothetical protein